MKKSKVTRVLAILLASAVTLGVAAFALDDGSDAAEPMVLFDASKAGTPENPFSFPNTEVYKDGGEFKDNIYPDLFKQMKDVMPGDEVKDTITVRVINASGRTVKMYLRAENPNGVYQTLLPGPGTEVPKVELTASIAGSPEERLTVLDKLFSKTEFNYDSTYPGTDGVVYLGAFSGSQSDKTIDVTLKLDPELDNTYENLTSSIDWVFVAEVNKSGGGGGGEITPPGPGPGPEPILNTKDHYGYIIGYPVDYYTGEPTEYQPRMPVYPERNITRAEVATIFFRMLTDDARNKYWSTTNSFSDVPGYMWFNNAISTLANAGIINGYPNGKFGPDDPITRAEFATIGARFFERNPGSTVPFSDIDGHWAEESILKAASRGIVNGYPDGTFRPDVNIIRYEAMTMMNRILGRNPIQERLLPDMLKWPDNADTSQWYYEQVQEATNSHEYVFDSDGYETWTKMLEIRDWVKFEREWSDANSAKNPGEVVSSNGK